MREDRRLTLGILPQTTVELAAMLPREKFAAAIGAPLLLVRITDGDEGEVAQTLLASLSAETAALVPTLAFRTVAVVRPRDALASGKALLPSATRASAIRAWLTESAHAHIAVPLRKREAGKTFTTRISVGRAMNNDVVIRHESISKFHAWLEADEEGNLYISDAGSRNGTFVHDARLVAKECTLVPFGAELRFAAIVTIACEASTLWDCLRGLDAPSG